MTHATTILQIFLTSPKPVVRFGAIRTLNMWGPKKGRVDLESSVFEKCGVFLFVCLFVCLLGVLSVLTVFVRCWVFLDVFSGLFRISFGFEGVFLCSL